MKRLMMILCLLLLLAGCTPGEQVPTQPPTDPPTEPLPDWVEEGTAWDAEGVLREIPLTVPDGLHYTAAVEFDGDLLLWSTDRHLKDNAMLELTLVELDNGTVIAQKDVPIVGYVYPQCLGDTLYVCDGTGGRITELDKNLEIRKTWEIEPTEEYMYMYMGAGDILYRSTSDSDLLRQDLTTGEIRPLLEEDPDIAWTTSSGENLSIRYYRPENGSSAYCFLDLTTGEVIYSDADSQIDGVTREAGCWLYEVYGDNYTYYLYTDSGGEYRIVPEGANLRLLDEGYLLGTTMDCSVVSLYDLQGKLLTSARLSEEEMGYISDSVIWNEAHGGYYLFFRSYEETARLLFWDVEASMGGSDLPVEDIPAPDEAQSRLEARAKELGDRYGLSIFVGTQCETVFDEFTATQATNYDDVDAALDVLENALKSYPEGFIRQLRYGEMREIRVHLIRDLQADGSGRTGGGYNGFTQSNWDHSLMVIDIEESAVWTYYHEFSHLIDNYLEWDAQQRTGAIYSETSWAGLNPGWFEGYTQDYSQQADWYSDAFIDGYATIRPTEDRARIMEYAMQPDCGFCFEPGTAVSRKLEYYCRCIRDAFDTSAWTEDPLWEQYV